MWYFELQPDYVASTYTPRIARTFVLLSSHVKVLLEWIQFWYDMITLFVQNNIQKPERKICSESRDIDENDIVQWLGETFDIFRRLAAK